MAPRRTVLRRIAPLVAVLGVALLLSPVAERWPSTHPIDVALPSPATVTQVSLIVSHGSEDLLSTTWTFSPGEAPGQVSTAVRGPEGAYEMIVDITRKDGVLVSRRHHLELDGERRVILHAR